MGSSNAKVSRNIFDRRRRYVYPILQQGVPWIDADENDGRQSFYAQLRHTILASIGQNGSPNDGFKIVGTGATNDFSINGGGGTEVGAGLFFAKGNIAFLYDTVNYKGVPASGLDGEDQRSVHPKITNIVYASGPDETTITDSAAKYVTDELAGRTIYLDIENNSLSAHTIISNTENDIVISGDQTSDTFIGKRYRVELSTPSGSNRDDGVYINIYLDEVDADEDTNLKHEFTTGTTGVEAQFRQRIEHTIFVREDTTTHGEPSDYIDSDGNQHYIVKLAHLERLDGNATITAGMVNDLRKSIAPGTQSIPVGGVIQYDGTTVPVGFLFCRGQSVLKGDYPELDAHYAAQTPAYPHGSTATTFTLPDMQIKIPIGQDASGSPDTDFDTLGETGGNKEINLEHNHGLSAGGTSTDGSHNHNGITDVAFPDADISGQPFSPGSTHHSHPIDSDGNHSHTLTGNTDNAGSTTENIMNPYLVINYIIKF